MAALKHLAFIALFGLNLSACGLDPLLFFEVDPTYDPNATRALAKQTLGDLQVPSYRNNREYCGYIGVDPAGTLSATPATPGLPSECTPENPPSNWIIVASYHTHGAYSPDADAEVPSVSDVEADAARGINGYVSTPGGRVWLVRGESQDVQLLCGPRCLTQDPFYIPDTLVQTYYNLEGLRRRGNEGADIEY